MPHVYFISNQPKFDTKLIKNDEKIVRLISVPSFSTSQEVVLVDLDTLNCHPIKFSTWDSSNIE